MSVASRIAIMTLGFRGGFESGGGGSPGTIQYLETITLADPIVVTLESELVIELDAPLVVTLEPDIEVEVC